MRVKFIALLTVLVVVPALVFAAPVVITWEWLLEDPMVTTFRYQLDGEDEANWTVVDSFVTSYTEYDLDGSVPHTLYLQQSYDGINFSGSALSVADPLVDDLEVEVFEEPVIEEPVVVAEEPAVVEEPEAIVAVAPVAEVAPKAVKAKPASRYYTTITLGGTFNQQLSDGMATGYHESNVKVDLGVNFNNIITLNKAMGLGLDIDVAYSPFLKSSVGWEKASEDLLYFKFKDFFGDFDQALDASLAVMLNMHASKVAFDLGLGAFLIWGPEFADTSGNNIAAGALAKASLAYRFNKTISLGVSGTYGVVLSEGKPSSFGDLPMFAEGSLFLGFSF